MKRFRAIGISMLISLPVIANPFNDALLAKSSADRASAMAEVLQKSGKACAKVTNTFLQGSDADDAAYWNAMCSNGNSYAIQIPANPGASSRIMECSIMEANGAPCFEPME